MCAWFSNFFENPFVSRVKRRMCMSLALALSLSRRVDCARILCVFGIVYSHVIGPWRFGYEASPRAEFLYFFVSDSVFHAGVPMLSIVSAFLVFRVFENSDYVRILRKKAGTLLLPAFLWSLLLAGRLSVSRFSDLLVKLAPLTFFIYCFHGPFMKTMSRLYYKFIYTGFPGEFEVLFVASGAVTILAAIVSAKVLVRVWPYGMNILSGRRLGRAPAARTADEPPELTPALEVGALADGTTIDDGRRG
jgi:surface polysaccharide O-acyltransferase-like enzyme